MKKKIIILSLALMLLFITSISFAQEMPNDDNLTAPDNIEDSVSAEPTKITIQVVWDDNNDAQGLRPDNLTFHFKGYDEILGFFNLTSNDNWQKTWEIEDGDNLANLVLDEFYVPEGYEVSYSGNINDGFVVTNKLLPNDTEDDKPLSASQDNPTPESDDDKTTGNGTAGNTNDNSQDALNNGTPNGTNQQTPVGNSNQTPQNNTQPTQQNNTNPAPANKTQPAQQNNTQKDKTYNATKVPEEPKKKPPVEDKHPNTGYPILLFAVACILLAVAYYIRKKR